MEVSRTVLCPLWARLSHDLVVLLAHVPHSPYSGYHNSCLCIQDIYEPVTLHHQLVNPFLPAQAPNPPMPLEQSDALLNLSNPNIIIGPRKCRATERLLENGDPLVRKKNKAVPTGMTVISASADKDKLDNHPLSSKPPLPLTHPTHTAPGPRKVTNHTEGGDDKASDGAQAIVVEDSSEGESDEGTGSDEGASTEEDDDTELGACCVVLVGFQPSAN